LARAQAESFFLRVRELVLPRVVDGHLDEGGGQGLKLLAIGDGGLEGWGLGGRDALGDIGAVAPDLVFEVGTDLLPRRVAADFGSEAAHFHGGERCHLLENGGTLGLKIGVHAVEMPSN
jgi:hypothetical protein